MDEFNSQHDKEEQMGGDNSRRKRKKENSFVEFLHLYGKYIIIALIMVLVVAAVIIVVGKVKKSGASRDATVIDVNTGTSAEAGETLEKDAYPEINELVNAYFSAVENCDEEALSKLVASTDSISAEQLQAEKEFMESYQNIECYTVKGLIDGTYITYVAYDMKFLNVDTLAPSLIRMYICTNDAGDLYINNLDVDNEVATYMNEVNAREEVQELLQSVDTKLTEAMASDEGLNALVTKLYGREEESSSETQQASSEETTAAPETTEPQTEAPATDAPADSSTFTDVDETVYAKENVKVRKTPDANGEEAGTLAGGQSIHRTGYNDGWSRVEFNGETCYIAAGYLTMTAPGQGADDGFTAVDETVYAKETVRIRKSPSADAEVVGSLLEGESLKRTGYNDGWSRVIYEGETCYIGAGFLTTAAP